MPRCRFCGTVRVYWRNTNTPDPALTATQNAMQLAASAPRFRMYNLSPSEPDEEHHCPLGDRFYRARRDGDYGLTLVINEYLRAHPEGTTDLRAALGSHYTPDIPDGPVGNNGPGPGPRGDAGQPNMNMGGPIGPPGFPGPSSNTPVPLPNPVRPLPVPAATTTRTHLSLPNGITASSPATPLPTVDLSSFFDSTDAAFMEAATRLAVAQARARARTTEYTDPSIVVNGAPAELNPSDIFGDGDEDDEYDNGYSHISTDREIPASDIKWLGLWSSTEVYNIGHVVNCNQIFYICKRNKCERRNPREDYYADWWRALYEPELDHFIRLLDNFKYTPEKEITHFENERAIKL